MALKEIAFLANWARNDNQFLEMASSITRFHRIAVQAVLHSLEKAALAEIEEEKISTLQSILAAEMPKNDTPASLVKEAANDIAVVASNHNIKNARKINKRT